MTEEKEKESLTTAQYVMREAKKHGLAFMIIVAAMYYFKTNFDKSLDQLRNDNIELKQDVKSLNNKYIDWLENDNKEMRTLIEKTNTLLIQVEKKL